MKRTIHAVVIVCLAVVVIQLIGYSSRQGVMYSSVGSALGRLIRSDEVGFRKDVLEAARGLRFQLEERDIRIMRDLESDRIDVEVKYRGKMRILFFDIERETIIWQYTTDLGM